MKTKTTAIALVVMFLMTGTSAISGGSVVRAASQSFRVAVTSNYPGDVPQYTLTFTLNVSVSAGATLTFAFDNAVGRAKDTTIDSSLISVDGTFLSKVADWEEDTLSLAVPQGLAAGTEHTVIISADAGIQNPWTVGHYRITLDCAAGKTTVVSNYYSVTTVTQLVPLSFDRIVEYGQLTGVTISFKTGRNGALIGHDPVRFDAQGRPIYPTTEDTMTLRLSAGLSTLWTDSGFVKLLPAYAGSPFAMTVVSSTVYATSDEGSNLRQLVLSLPHNLPANTEMSLYLMFATAQDVSALSSADYVKFYTSRETTLVTLPQQVSTPDAGSGSGTTTITDTTAPVITWTSSASALLPRLVTLQIVVTEDNLDEAWFSGGTDSLIHTRLSPGDNEVMVINRSGIHGTVTATDKSGNTTTVLVDLPALAGS